MRFTNGDLITFGASAAGVFFERAAVILSGDGVLDSPERAAVALGAAFCTSLVIFFTAVSRGAQT